MKVIIVKILLAISFAFAANVALAQEAAPAVEEKTLRQMPEGVQEIDVASVPSFSGNWTSLTNRQNFQEFKYSNSEKKVEWWIRAARKSLCSTWIFKVEKAFENQATTYLKLVPEKAVNPVCQPSVTLLLLEVSKGKKEGFYSVAGAEGTLSLN